MLKELQNSVENKEEDTVKFIKYLQLRWCGHVERIAKFFRKQGGRHCKIYKIFAAKMVWPC